MCTKVLISRNYEHPMSGTFSLDMSILEGCRTFSDSFVLGWEILNFR